MGQVSEIDVKLPHFALENADWADAYQAVRRIENGFLSARQAGDAIVSAFPKITYPLLLLRQIIMFPFGLKGTKHAGEMSVDSIGFFPIISETQEQIVVGFDDKHLDFRLVIDLNNSASEQSVSLATVIRRHNWVGRTYLATILPFHRWIIRQALANMKPAQE